MLWQWRPLLKESQAGSFPGHVGVGMRAAIKHTPGPAWELFLAV